ncbi:hypothetical protein Ahy_A07g034397 isoform I [Arachis hypogaea]|uniref:Uncharacterized protein n=1 Tax=Arachis hypogaea TaxID=3818 RepID=A0A445CBT2_ARAHY|nr:hypothetical protein Ahy_A07g034397 isoform I [Arachis hypogaea]
MVWVVTIFVVCAEICTLVL